MEMAGRVYKTLLVSPQHNFNNTILPLLEKGKCEPVVTVSDGATARRVCLESAFDIVIINAPLTDEFGTKLALDLSANNDTGVMLFVKAEHFPDITGRVSPYGILTISKPTVSSVVTQSLLLLCATRERLRRLEQKTASIEEKMEEIRIVNRAKWLLIDNLKMTEPDAHRYIEKTAMDRCVTKREVAHTIIKTYE